MDLMTIIHLLISGFIIGIIFFQTALAAPIVFKYLAKDQSSIYLRKIFPRLFSVIFFLGIISAVIDILNESSNSLSLLTSITTITLAALCYLMVPATNRATDAGDHKKFKQLHALSVIFILIVFFANMLWPFF